MSASWKLQSDEQKSKNGQNQTAGYFLNSSHSIRIIITHGHRRAIYADIAVLYDMHVG